MVDFVNIRSHFYDLRRDGLLANRRDDTYRRAMTWLLKIVSEHGQITATTLRTIAKSCDLDVENAVQEAALNPTDWDRFLVGHDQLLELTEYLAGESGQDERFVRLRGTLHDETNVFLPRLYFN